MSGDGIHVHGPHDHALEHAAEHGSEDSFSGRIAVTTAILATVGAMMSYEGGATQAEAMLAKNESTIHTVEASDAWNFFQAKSTKQNLAEVGAVLATNEEAINNFKKKAKDYETDKAKIHDDAKELQAKAEEADHRSEHAMHEHHRWAQATTLIQIAIALSAIALLTRKKWLQWGVYGVGAVSIAIGACALAGI